ncbi:hypothetical protein JCM5353_006581, partial [Sporobolomyces roseus]
RQLALLERRRAIAVEQPLGSTIKLPFTSSNLHPEGTVDVALLDDPNHPSPNPLRPVNESLLRRLEQSPSNLEIKLLKTLQSGTEKWSQVWTATVEGEGKVYGNVIVKLLVESLYPYPEGSWVAEEVEVFDWWSAKWFESREARAYAAFRSLQGRDVPICYGFYRFRVPWGEDVVGIVLEDLSDPKIAVTFEDCYKFNMAKPGKLTVEGIDPIVSRILGTQRRLQDSELVDFGFGPTDVLVLNTTTEAEPHIVFLDFGDHRTKEIIIKFFTPKEADHSEPTDGANYGRMVEDGIGAKQAWNSGGTVDTLSV